MQVTWPPPWLVENSPTNANTRVPVDDLQRAGEGLAGSGMLRPTDSVPTSQRCTEGLAEPPIETPSLPWDQLRADQALADALAAIEEARQLDQSHRVLQSVLDAYHAVAHRLHGNRDPVLFALAGDVRHAAATNLKATVHSAKERIRI